jgi:hypothetical protein
MKQITQNGFAHIQVIVLVVLVLGVVGFAAFRVGQTTSNNQAKDTIDEPSLAQDITIKEDEQKEVTIPAEKTEAEQAAVEKPAPTTTTEKKPAPTTETVKKEKVWLNMEQVSAVQTGSFLNVVSRLPSAQSGKCQFKLYQSGFEKVYTYTTISNATDCSGSLDVFNLPTYSGWELHVWFEGFDGKTQGGQKEAPMALTDPN